MLSHRLLNASLLSLVFFGGISGAVLPAQAASDSAPEVSSLRNEAFAALDAWRKLNPKKAGVYFDGEYVFSYVVHSYNSRKGNVSVIPRAQIAAESAAIQQLAGAVLKDVYAQADGEDRLLRHYPAAKQFRFEGRVLVSKCMNGICEVVYQTTKAVFEAQKAKLDKDNLVQEARRDFKNHPDAYGSFLAESGFPDAALIFRIRCNKASFFNVPLPFVPTEAQSAAFEQFASKRRNQISSLLKNLPADVAVEESLAMRAVIALDEEASFRKALTENGIPTLKWNIDLPLLKAVAIAQGFVKFEQRASASEPTSMGYVRQLFAEGKNLALALNLLEDAAARHPANPEVWEYLAAGYYAAGNRDASRIATRVWLCLSKEIKKPLIYFATHFDADGNGRTVAQLLQ